MIPVIESADTAEMRPDGDNYNIASQIALNIKGEYDAIEGYNKLIPWLRDDEDSIEKIKHIISEEKKHVITLNEILAKHDGNILPEDEEDKDE